MEMVEKAKKIAHEAHGNQKYGDNLPYMAHLESVAGVLARFKYDRPELQVAAYLHDILEDTSYPEQELKELFGEDVVRIVRAVTNEPGQNRKERHEKTYPKIAANLDALTVKLADRIANVEASLASGGKFLEMYRKEYEGFRRSLYDARVADLWDHLDSLMAYR